MYGKSAVLLSNRKVFSRLTRKKHDFPPRASSDRLDVVLLLQNLNGGNRFCCQQVILISVMYVFTGLLITLSGRLRANREQSDALSWSHSAM